MLVRTVTRFRLHGRWLLRASVALWLALVLAISAWLWKYKLTPATAAELVPHWPSASSLAVEPGRPTLVLFAHPRCPCTRASLAELRKVLSPFAERMTAHVVFFRPGESSRDWSRTDTFVLAGSIPGVRVAIDVDGREAARFGAATSGHVSLYSKGGELLFSGGITPGRGHEGDSPQERALIERLRSATSAGLVETNVPHPGAVYGCSLRDGPPEARP